MQTQQGRQKGGKTISLTRGRVVGATVALVLAVTVAVGATAIVRSGGGGSGGGPPREPAAEASGLREHPGEVAAGLGQVAAPPATAPTTGAPAPEHRGETIGFAGTTFELPEGWTVVDQDVRHWIEIDPVTGTTTEHPYDNLCIGPSDLEPWCAIQLWHGDLPGNEGFRAWEDHGDWPWWQGTDPAPCPGGSGSTVSTTDYGLPVGDELGPVDRGFASVGDHTAVYDRWAVECRFSGLEYSPRTWHLPDSQIVILDMFGQAETDGILRTFRFTG